MRSYLILVSIGLLALSGCATSTTGQTETAMDDSSAKATDANQIFTMPYRLETLDNGLKVMIVRTDFPDIVSLQIPVQTGSRNEVEPGKSGFAHFFEHMMFRGTETYPASEYGEILKNAGADQNAFTTDDFTNYHITFTKADLEKMLELEADRFQNLKYSEDQFRTEALAVKGEYLKNYSNPIQKLLEVGRDRSFTTHTYKHTTMGFLRDIEDMPNQMDYSRTFFDRWYRPEKASVIVVGDVDPDATLAMVRKYFGNWQRGSYDVPVPTEPPPSGPIYEHVEWEAPTQPWLLMAWRGPAFDPTEKDMPAMDVLSSIYFSPSSDVYQKVVNTERLADQFFAYFPNRKDPGLLYIGARLTDEANASKVQDAINETLQRARTEAVDDTILANTKSRLRYQFTSQMDNSESIGDMLASFMQHDRDPQVINEAYARYASITADDLTRLADRYFVDVGRTTLTLSNAPAVPDFDANASLDQRVADSRRMAPSAVDVFAMPSASSPLIDVSVVIHAGSADDPVGKKGLAALTAAMVTGGGSTSRSIQEIEQAMYPIAAGFNAQVDKEMTRLAGGAHRDNLAVWYGLVKDQLLSPGWRDDDFERIKQQHINAIRTDLVGNNDEELGKEVLYASIYGPTHPYGVFNIGRSDDLESLTLDDVRAFYVAHYTSDNVTLGLAGGYDEAFAAKVEKDLGRLPARTPASKASVAQAPAFSGRDVIIVEKETPAVAVSFGFPIDVKRGDPDWVALWLLRSYLGEHRSSNSYLYDRIRETRGMNYGDYAYIEYFPRGMYQFHPDANLGREQQIFQVWIRPLRTNNDAHFATRVAIYEIDELLRNGLDQESFDATRNYLDKFVSLLVKTQSRQLGYGIDSEYYDIDSFTNYVRAGLAKLTLADVNRVLRENVQTDDMKMVFIAKDADDLKQRLAGDLASPIQYNTPKPELAEEDERIANYALQLDAERIRVVPADLVFK
ncbi:MAG: M16 family metallopeptidase [Gammaproteobacteria bacterium]